MIGLPNPWVILGTVALIASAAIGGHHYGYASAEKDAENKDLQKAIQVSEASQRAAAEIRMTDRNLQDAADLEREDNAKQITDLSVQLAAAVGELRKRPQRPDSANNVSKVAGAGPAGCTGAGLYAGDSEFLIRQAATAARITAQRDQCYRLYDKARQALDALAPASP